METLTGHVLEEKKWSETQVHGSGGGGYMRDGSGFIHPVRIASTLTTRHEFWIAGTDGRELCVALGDSPCRVRPGQSVAVAWGARQGRDRGPFLMLENRASGERWWLAADAVLLGSMGLRDPLTGSRFTLLVFVAFMWFGAGTAGHSPVSGTAFCIMVGSAYLLWRLRREKQAAVAEAKLKCAQALQAELAGAGRVR